MMSFHVRSHLLGETNNADFIGLRHQIWSISVEDAKKRRAVQQRSTSRISQRTMSSNYPSVLYNSD